MRSSKWQGLLVATGIFLFALLLRVAGLTWGLPDATHWGSYHPDESPYQLVGGVISVALKGDLNPHFFNYPSLSIYATALFYEALIMSGAGTLASSQPWPLLHEIILAGRIFSALCGAGTAVAVLCLAHELGLRRGAILAGILTALAPGLVQHSHFATVDVPATFGVAVVLWLSARAFRLESWKLLLGAASVAGLATGTKYNAVLVLIVPLFTAFLLPKRPLWIFPAVIGLGALGFFLSTPYALLAPKEFWGDPNQQAGFAYELLYHPREGSGDIFQGTGNGWIYHLTFNLPFALTWPLLLAGLYGAFLVRRERPYWPLLLFSLLYFVVIGLSQVRYMRYTFFLLPPLLVWASIAAARLPKPKVWAALTCLFALAGSFDALYPFVTPDPRDKAKAALPPQIQSVGLATKPWFYTVPFQPQNLNALPQNTTPSIDVTDFDVAKLEAAKPDIFIISNFEYRENMRINPNGDAAHFLDTLGGDYGESTEYSNDIHLLPGRNFVPHDYLYTRPILRIYRSPRFK